LVRLGVVVHPGAAKARLPGDGDDDRARRVPLVDAESALAIYERLEEALDDVRRNGRG
jgi:hypothetical protein